MAEAAKVTRLRPRPKYDYAHVPDGEYQARVIDQATGMHFFGRQPKVVVWWSLLDPGHMETVLPAYYAVPGLSGKPRRYGRYKPVGMRSRLVRDLAVMLNERPPLNYYPLDRVQDGLFRIVTRTVTETYEQQSIPTVLRYSVVDRVLRREA